MTSVARCLLEAAARLPGDTPRLDAEILLAHALGRTRTWLYAHGEDQLDEESVRRFLGLVQARRDGEPVAYLVGRREFWSLELVVNADTLIPRPETELLVELALQRLPVNTAIRILDLGTGSAAIALALASERPLAGVVAVDVHARTLAMAEKNVAMLEFGNISLMRSDWYSALAGERFDVIVSNPPYIADTDPHLLGDLRHEPRVALASGIDGLDDIRIIVSQAPGHLQLGGWLLVEHGWEQGADVRGLFIAAGFSCVTTVRDLGERERVTLGLLL